MYIKPVSSIAALPTRRKASAFDFNRDDPAGAAPFSGIPVPQAFITAATLNQGNYKGAQAEVAAQLWASRNTSPETDLDQQSHRRRYAADVSGMSSNTVSMSA